MDQLKALNELGNVEDAKTSVESFQCIVIRLGEEQFGIDIRFIDNIVKRIINTLIRIKKAHPALTPLLPLSF